MTVTTGVPFGRGGSKGEKSSGKPPGESVTNDTSDTPPRRGATGGGASGPRPAAKRTSTRKLERSLEELFSSPALIYAIKGDAWAQKHITDSAPIVAKAWADLADESPAVKRVLMRITEGTAWGAVIVTSGAYAVPLLIHHNLVPPVAGLVFGDQGEPSPDAPIVPPPPAPTGDAPVSSRMTPPIREGQPPGVVTVEGTNSAHR